MQRHPGSLSADRSRFRLGCSGIKPSPSQSCDSCFFFFFPPPSKLRGRAAERRGVPARFPTGRRCDVPPAHTDCSSLGVTFFLSPAPNLSFAMAGAIIENMSTKKLVIGGIALLLFQALAFMVGGLCGKFFFLSFFFFFTFFFVVCCSNLAPGATLNVSSERRPRQLLVKFTICVATKGDGG